MAFKTICYCYLSSELMHDCHQVQQRESIWHRFSRVFEDFDLIIYCSTYHFILCIFLFIFLFCFYLPGTDGQEKSSSEAPLEIQREHSVENISVNSHSNSYSEDRLYLSGNIMRSTFGYMKVICPKDLIEHQAISQQSPTCINSEKVQYSNVMVEPLKETLVKLARREVGTYSTGPAIDPFWPLCMYELRGKCNNDECPWQHVKDYSNTNMHQHQHDNSGIAGMVNPLTNFEPVFCFLHS